MPICNFSGNKTCNSKLKHSENFSKSEIEGMSFKEKQMYIIEKYRAVLLIVFLQKHHKNQIFFYKIVWLYRKF